MKMFLILHCNYPLRNYYLLSLAVISMNIYNYQKAIKIFLPFSSTCLCEAIFYSYTQQNNILQQNISRNSYENPAVFY
jgi:hypothetical protein